MSTKVITIIRAFPRYGGQMEQFYDVTSLPWKEHEAFTKELEMQGYWVQGILLQDPMAIQVSAELRRRYEKEQETPK
jgi:hypothetical protein